MCWVPPNHFFLVESIVDKALMSHNNDRKQKYFLSLPGVDFQDERGVEGLLPPSNPSFYQTPKSLDYSLKKSLDVLDARFPAVEVNEGKQV